MSDAHKTNQLDILGKQIFDSGVDLFLELASRQAENGMVSVDKLRSVAKAIHKDPVIREKYCEGPLEHVSEILNRTERKTPRMNVYGRIIAQPFEGLLNTDNAQLATRQLTNFFFAIEAILGRALYESYMERSTHLMERLTAKRGAKFTYYDLYSDPEAWEIRWDSFIQLASFFGKFNIRKEWFMRIMHSDPEMPGQGTGPYPYTTYQFKQQMMCIFTEFTNLSDEEKAIFDDRYTKKQRKELSKFLANVAAIEAEA